MNTMTTRERAGQSRWVWLVSMALVTAVSGCAGCQSGIRMPPWGKGPEAGTGTETGSSATPTTTTTGCPGGPTCGIQRSFLGEISDAPPTNCPTGNCDPGGTGNAKGIYTAEGGNYCFEARGERFFCPEAFFNTPTGVEIELRLLDSPRTVMRRQVKGKLAAGNTPIDLVSFKSDRTELTLQYRLQGQAQVRTATGAELSKLVLAVYGLQTGSGDASPILAYELRFSPLSTPAPDAKVDRVHRYTLEYRDIQFENTWRKHCQADQGTPAVSFLQGQRVNGVNASVKLEPQVTTMGCEQGSIVTCLAWGYTPWAPDTGVRDETRDYVFRSCLQAKRAAYFVGQGDFQSYTCVGTKIDRWDQYGFGEGTPVERVEALWSPRGAVCFNPENRRREKADAWKGQDPQHLKTYGVPSCTSKDFTLEGKFFSGLPGMPSREPCPASAKP